MLLEQYHEAVKCVAVAEETIDGKGDSEIEDVIKRYSDNPNLYSTYIPNSSRYVSRKKLP